MWVAVDNNLPPWMERASRASRFRAFDIRALLINGDLQTPDAFLKSEPCQYTVLKSEEQRASWLPRPSTYSVHGDLVLERGRLQYAPSISLHGGGSFPTSILLTNGRACRLPRITRYLILLVPTIQGALASNISCYDVLSDLQTLINEYVKESRSVAQWKKNFPEVRKVSGKEKHA